MKKTIEELNLLDDFLFQEVLSDEEHGEFAAKLLLSAIMGYQIREITVHTQKVISSGDTVGHGIRLDVYMEEKPEGRNEKTVIYDMEVQKENTYDLPGRSRYYQAIMDSKMLKTDEPYKKLRKIWIIIIMPKDIFKQNRMCYTFEYRCVEDHRLALGDGARRLFLYCGGKDSNRKELGEILRYMEDSRAENTVNEKIRELHKVVDKIKHKHEVGVRYMKAIEYEYMIREEGREEGRKEVREEAQKEVREKVQKEVLEVREEAQKEVREKGIRTIIRMSQRLQATYEQTLESLKEESDLTDKEAKEYMEKYWS